LGGEPGASNAAARAGERYGIGVDIGGTFTDCTVVSRGGAIYVGKVPTTRHALSEGFFGSIADAAAQIGIGVDELYRRSERLSHGTTVGINAIVTRTGAKVGLLATKGHGDAIRIMDNSGRITGVSIEEVLDYTRSRRPRQFVEREHIVEVTERLDSKGRIVVPLNEDEVRRGVARLLAGGVEAFAVSYLWGFLRPEHELRTAEIIREEAGDTFISLAHATDPRLGEYERTVTTVLNAYVGPLMHDYIGAIVDGAAAHGFGGDVLFAHSDGGLVTADFARRHPIITLQSGPVGGVVASANVGLYGGMPNVIATDMGGTTLDVSVIYNGRPSVADVASVEQHAFHLRKVDVESVGAGGGSIAWIDKESNTLRVGPHSAGAVPGPACYGRGGREATVTDADVVLGIIDPEGSLGGDLKIDGKAARAAVGELAQRLGMTVEQCAAGIVEIVDSKMEDLVRRVTLQRGHDPRDFQLWAYGGHAGAHATLYARDLGVQTVVVPMGNLASVFSSFGIGTADIVRTREASRHLRTPFDQTAIDTLNQTFAELQQAAIQDCVAMGARPQDVKIERTANLKYALQVFEVETPVPDGHLDEAGAAKLIANFDAAYEQRYGKGSRYAEAGYALTEVRVRASVAWDRPQVPREAATDKPLARRTSRQVYWQEYGKAVETPIYAGGSVHSGHRIEGPAVIEYRHTTVVVRPNQTAKIDPIGNVVIDLSAMAIGSVRAAKQKVAS